MSVERLRKLVDRLLQGFPRQHSRVAERHGDDGGGSLLHQAQHGHLSKEHPSKTVGKPMKLAQFSPKASKKHEEMARKRLRLRPRPALEHSHFDTFHLAIASRNRNHSASRLHVHDTGIEDVHVLSYQII